MNHSPVSSPETQHEETNSGFNPTLATLALAVFATIVIGTMSYWPRLLGGTSFLRASASQIAFMSNRDGSWDVYLMDRDGSNVTNVTNASETNDGLPLVAPRQSYLAFASDRNGESGLALFLANYDGSDVTQIETPPNSNNAPLAWSPDGTKMVFGHELDSVQSVMMYDTATKAITNLSDLHRVDTFGAWAPDSQRFILAAANGEGGVDMFVANTDGQKLQSLTDGSYIAGLPAWSPDGQAVAFVAIMDPDASGPDIFSVGVNGGEPTNLTQSASNDIFPKWSPDGTQIAFVTDRDGNSEIYVMDADGQNPRNLTNSPATESPQGDFDWSPDGAQILFHTDIDGNVEVYVVDVDTGETTNISNSPATDMSGNWVR